VGSGGRGFVAETGGQTLIVTAAHCLPNLPPGMGGGALTEELTYANILGQLGEEPTAWAECLFVDPVADLAVLGSPDGQELFEEAAAYEALVESKAMAIGRVPLVRPPVILLG